ncbi:MAG: TetR/AcrR family transcriptional regulator [Kutzneria sp.]|nr:TetR/AcrR family transcriptional regulator [Kutzneria sp.]
MSEGTPIGDRGPRRRGRPTDPGLERRILDAARRQLATRGYAGMTVADVAAEAGVTRPTVYKRWPSKAELVTASLQYSVTSEEAARRGVVDMPAREAVSTILCVVAEVVASPVGIALIGSVLVEGDRMPSLLGLVRQNLVEPGWAQVTAVLQRAERDGVIRAGLDLDALVAMLCGAVILEYLRHGTVDEAVVERLLDTIWPALTAPPRP